uniref:Uncharacterized protein n=1 Tax=Nothobranchius furzeri TaxID=105023 RepID=A0A8C6LSL9_NOTFU
MVKLIAAPWPARAVSLPRSGSNTPEVDALVGGAAMKTQVQVLVITLLHRIHNLLWHSNGEGQVAAHLPDYNGCPDIPGLDLHVLPGHLLHHSQGADSVWIATISGAVGERSRQLVRLGVVRLLLHAFLEVLEDDRQLQEERAAPNIRRVLLCTKKSLSCASKNSFLKEGNYFKS